MNPDDISNNAQPGFAFQLPDEFKMPDDKPKPAEKVPASDSELAADLIRKKVEAAYTEEPDAVEEALDVASTTPKSNLSKHQQFISDLTNSGKSSDEIKNAWHEYYAGLTDVEKHQVWQEFNSVHARDDNFGIAQPAQTDLNKYEQRYEDLAPKKTKETPDRTLADLKEQMVSRVAGRSKLKPKQHLQSLLFGLCIGSVVVLIFLFSFFNERFIAPFIQPSRNATSTPIISSSISSSDKSMVVIPKINVEIPVIYNIDSIDEAVVQKALQNGVVHYADTAVPGQNGNVAIVGHSSNNIFNQGKYKFAFVLLSRLDNKDIFYLDKDGKRYTYEVYEKKIIDPTDVSILGPQSEPATATLITCDPPGTSIHRLVVIGKQISPDPAGNQPENPNGKLAISTKIVPGNSPSLWSKLWSWL